MKKTVIFILCIVVMIVSVLWVKYINYQSEASYIKKENLEYETYLNQSIKGIELTTAINRAINNNEKNSVEKDKQGFYIADDNNSIQIDIKIIDQEEDTIYKMETFYNGGMEKFIQYYGDITFECTKIDYNSKGKVSYLIFEQKNT